MLNPLPPFFPQFFSTCARKTGKTPEFLPTGASSAKMAVFANPGILGLAPQLAQKSAENFPTGASLYDAQLGKTAENRPIAQMQTKFARNCKLPVWQSKMVTAKLAVHFAPPRGFPDFDESSPQGAND